jgi:hypothetical protein
LTDLLSILAEYTVTEDAVRETVRIATFSAAALGLSRGTATFVAARGTVRMISRTALGRACTANPTHLWTAQVIRLVFTTGLLVITHTVSVRTCMALVGELLEVTAAK